MTGVNALCSGVIGFVGFILGAIMLHVVAPNFNQDSVPEVKKEVTPAVQEDTDDEKPEIDYVALVSAMIVAESDWNEELRGKRGEIGLMQCRPEMWREACKKLSVKWPHKDARDHKKNITVGFTYYLIQEDFWRSKGYAGENLIKKAVESYNAGRSKIKRGYIPRITRRHWAKVKKYYYSHIDNYEQRTYSFDVEECVENVLQTLDKD